MSITDQGVPEFAHAFRGYERTQVDAYVAQYREYMAQVEVRAAAAESALQQCRRELASSPTTAGVSQRLAAILQLAEEEADQIRARAQVEHEATTHRAASEAEQTITHATQHRDAIQREIDDLSAPASPPPTKPTIPSTPGWAAAAAAAEKEVVPGGTRTVGPWAALVKARPRASTPSASSVADPKSEMMTAIFFAPCRASSSGIAIICAVKPEASGNDAALVASAPVFTRTPIAAMPAASRIGNARSL